MPRFEFPRARGGRGPQVGPGTFQGRSDPIGPPRPEFGAIVWSPGPGAPSTELWCIRNGRFQVPDLDVGDSHSHLIVKVPDAQAFVPPEGSSPSSIATINSLKNYAKNRLFDVFQISTTVDDWSVLLAQPLPVPAGASNLKLLDGVYRVAQPDRPTSYIPLAWVWVSNSGSREIWLYYRPNEVDGFHFVGTQPPGDIEVYASTEVRYTRINPATVGDWNAQTNYGASIDHFKDAARLDTDSPAANLADLVVHDLRVQQF